MRHRRRTVSREENRAPPHHNIGLFEELASGLPKVLAQDLLAGAGHQFYFAQLAHVGELRPLCNGAQVADVDAVLVQDALQQRTIVGLERHEVQLGDEMRQHVLLEVAARLRNGELVRLGVRCVGCGRRARVVSGVKGNTQGTVRNNNKKKKQHSEKQQQ